MRPPSKKEAPAVVVKPAVSFEQVLLAVGPVPTALPLRGTEGQDADGYPTQYVDRLAFRALLRQRRFDELDSYFDQLQTAFEADARKEYWVADAADAFDTPESSLQEELDAWVVARPQSAAALLARGTYRVALGYLSRGGDLAVNTSEEQFAGMREAFGPAMADLDQALALRPRLIAALRRQINLSRGLGHDAQGALATRAEAACPSCFQLRVSVMYLESPSWGGSYAKMRAIAARAPVTTNPKLARIGGYADAEEAYRESLDKHYDMALAAIERACALGPHWEYYHDRARIHRKRDELEAALADHDRALALRPGHPAVLWERALTLQQMSRWEPAAIDAIASLKMDQKPKQKWLIDTLVWNLKTAGWKLHQQQKRDEALRFYDLAVELAPMDVEAQRFRAQILLHGLAEGPAGLAQAEAEARGAPDDFRAQQRLDYRRAMLRDFVPVVALWGDFLARHPDHARAYLERAGALHHLGRAAQARADAAHACDLGLSEACVTLLSLGPAAP
jgi:tetratricopeptide (TPR) repeat protein